MSPLTTAGRTVYGGLQDNGNRAGRAIQLSGGISEDWIMVNAGDGFVCRVDPHVPIWLRRARTASFAAICAPVRPRAQTAPQGTLAGRTQATRVLVRLLNKPLPVNHAAIGPQHRFSWNRRSSSAI